MLSLFNRTASFLAARFRATLRPMADPIRYDGPLEPSLGDLLRAAAADPAVDPKYVPILIRAAKLADSLDAKIEELDTRIEARIEELDTRIEEAKTAQADAIEAAEEIDPRARPQHRLAAR